jgi:hypothetical protein
MTGFKFPVIPNAVKQGGIMQGKGLSREISPPFSRRIDNAV